MKLLDIFATASSNMFRSKLRTTLTIIAIFIGAFTLTLTNGLGSGISKYIDQQVGNLGAKDVFIIQADGGSTTGLPTDDVKKYDPNRRTTSIESEGNRTVTVLTNEDINKIKKIDGIKSAEPYFGATIDYVQGKTDGKFIASVEPFLAGSNYALDAGQVPENTASAYEVMLPSTYLSPLGFSNAQAAIGQPVRFGVTNGFGVQSDVVGTIIGVKQKSLAGGSALTINTMLLTELRKVQHTGLPAGATTTFQIATARFDTSLSEAEVTSLKAQLKTAGYNASTIEDQIGAFKAVISGIVAVLNGFAIIALLAASFGIINTLLMSVQERTKEIGLMKAMGMGGGKIFLLFSGEAVMLGFWGSLIGSAVAIGAGHIINQVALSTFLKDLEGLKLLAFSPLSVAIIIGIVMAIAFLAGTLPAIRAARQNPIDSLRYE